MIREMSKSMVDIVDDVNLMIDSNLANYLKNLFVVEEVDEKEAIARLELALIFLRRHSEKDV